MKVREAIDRIDSLKHNTYTRGEKVEWLSRLDGNIKARSSIPMRAEMISYTDPIPKRIWKRIC